MWFFMFIGVLFIVIGLAVHVLKWHNLISGYNTMSKDKKAKVDTEGLGRFIGIYSYANGGVFITMGVLNAMGLKPVLTPVFVFFGISTVYILIRAQRFDGNIYDENGKLRKGAWKQFALPVIIVAVTLTFVAVLMFFSSQPTKVTISDEGVQIHGMYGDVYGWDSIVDVKLVDKLPTIKAKTNGSALGSNLKGYFRTTELGSVKLFVNTQKPPFVYLETNDGVVIFNMNNEDETHEIFSEMTRKYK